MPDVKDGPLRPLGLWDLCSLHTHILYIGKVVSYCVCVSFVQYFGNDRGSLRRCAARGDRGLCCAPMLNIAAPHHAPHRTRVNTVRYTDCVGPWLGVVWQHGTHRQQHIERRDRTRRNIPSRTHGGRSLLGAYHTGALAGADEPLRPPRRNT